MKLVPVDNTVADLEAQAAEYESKVAEVFEPEATEIRE
jgi:hypothetical protein